MAKAKPDTAAQFSRQAEAYVRGALLDVAGDRILRLRDQKPILRAEPRKSPA